MSDQTINQLTPSLKSLNTHITKLGQTVDQLNILVNQYNKLSVAYKQLAAQCQSISETIDQIEGVAFEMRQHHALLTEVCNQE